MEMFKNILKINLSRIVKVELRFGTESWTKCLLEGLFSFIFYNCVILCT